MSKKSIKSRYSIEYSYPSATQKNAKIQKSYKKPLLLVGGIVLLGLLSLILPFKSIESFFTASNNSLFKNNNVSSNTANNIDEFTSQIENDQEEITELIEEGELVETEELTTALNDLINNSDGNFVSELATTETGEVMEVIEIDVEQLLLDNKKQLEISKQHLIKNQELTQRLNELSQQLLTEKEKNHKLSSKINTHETKNDELTQLVNELLYKQTNNKDQKFVEELNTLHDDKGSLSMNTISSDTENLPTAEHANITRLEINKEIAKSIPDTNTSSVALDHNNAISLSTSSKIDAIVLAMQDIKRSTTSKSKKIAPALTRTPETTEQLLYISLQNQINKLLSSNDEKKADAPAKEYKEALIKESTIRNNAMRSITVKKGETLWSIAERAYGNGSYYKKIIEANPHIAKDGKITLSVGQVIRVPI